MTEPHDPQTAHEWQEAVDVAHACLALESARLYGLVAGGPDVNVERCEAILERGAKLGYTLADKAIEEFARELAAESTP